MNLKEFLRAVVPNGQMVIGWKGDRFHNSPAPTQAHALQQVIVKAKLQQPPDIYYALATFKQGWHKNAKGKSVLRVRENVDQLKALWFDIDFKDGLSDPTLVVAALREFSNRTGMPSPSILIHSGNGVHCYWPFTEAVPYGRWQRMADKLKELARETNLPIDLTCTADACRVLRPPGTKNWKDRSAPKPVRFLFTTDKLYSPAALEAALEPLLPANGLGDGLGSVPSYMQNGGAGATASEFTGMHSGATAPVDSFFGTISERCGVAGHWLHTRGADCSEPEWTAALQVLKHCTDRDLYVHEISQGHIDYSPVTTDEKFAQRLENDAGPTLCATLAGYREGICKACPHFNKVKTPLVLGVEASLVVPAGVVLGTWRAVTGGSGMERKMLNAETNQWEWIKKLRRTYDEVTTTCSINTSQYELQFKVKMIGARDIEIVLPCLYLGNDNKLRELMAGFGAPLGSSEVKEFKDLMGTWLSKLQQSRAETEAVEQLGWVRNESGEAVGFSAGSTTYMNDGSQREGVRIRGEFSAIGKLYVPRGDLVRWREVADFLTEQGNPAFTTILASAFAAPLLNFTNIQGGILSIVSPESGVGKSSALKCAQAVWGSPTQGMNSVDDTRLSVARKLGFLNNLPAYWDELRGRETMDSFTTLAFQVAQGKEKTRLDSSANMREVNTWQTMLIAASNESIFDNMGQTSKGSDAGVARTYEIIVEPFETDKSRAEVSILFGQLDQNYGQAGQLYAAYIAANHDKIEARVEKVFTQLDSLGKMRAAERIWFAIMASLIVGAQTANAAGLASFNIKALSKYLLTNIHQLRARSTASMQGTTPPELLHAYMQQHQDKALIVQDLHGQGKRGWVAQIIKPPRADRIVYQYAKDDGVVRVSKSDFATWLLKSKEIRWANVAVKFKRELNASEVRTSLGHGTAWALPRSACLDLKVLI